MEGVRGFASRVSCGLRGFASRVSCGVRGFASRVSGCRASASGASGRVLQGCSPSLSSLSVVSPALLSVIREHWD